MLEEAGNLQPPLELRRPLLNAAGGLGFAPPAHSPVALDRLGAFITNPISSRARRASAGPRLGASPQGPWLHSGWPNPGLRACVRRYVGAWTRSEIPIIVHLLASEPAALRRAVARIEELENVMAVEISIDHGADIQGAEELCRAARGELPLIARLPIEREMELYDAALRGGAAAISLAPPRHAHNGEGGGSGRLYGPGVFPRALQAVEAIAGQGAKVIGAGGVYTPEQARAMLAAGAMAVQLDTVLWKADTDLSEWPI